MFYHAEDKENEYNCWEDLVSGSKSVVININEIWDESELRANSVDSDESVTNCLNINYHSPFLLLI